MTEQDIQKYFFPQKLDKYNYNYFIPRTGIANFLQANQSEFNGVVLDLACGNRPYKKMIEDLGSVTEYQGMDISSEEIYENKADIQTWDGKQIPLGDETVDTILLTEFLEHVVNTEQVLNEVNRVLKPEGKIIGTVPFIYPMHETPHDQFRFTPFSLGHFLLSSGFKVEKISSLGGRNRFLAQAMSIWMLDQHGLKFKLTRWYKLAKMRKLIQTDQIENPENEGAVFTGLGFIGTKSSN